MKKLVQIRPSKPEDLDKILEVQSSALKTLSSSYNLRQIESLIRSQASARLAKDEVGFVAECHREIVGFASILIQKPEIAAVFVRPNFMGMGIGRLLVKSVEKIAIDRGDEVVGVISSLGAVNFYQKVGYQLVRSAGFYSEKKFWIPCVILKKQLIFVTKAQKRRRRFILLIYSLKSGIYWLLKTAILVIGIIVIIIIIVVIVNIFI